MSLISFYGRSILSKGLNKAVTPGIINSGTLLPLGQSFPHNGIIGPNTASQRRWKSRGNTYQPSTLKRKRKFGFIARMKDKFKSKMIKDRKDKGRWYLSH
ncbi:large ribosomal subunit protein bL34m, partial [Monosporozyma servazzii]